MKVIARWTLAGLLLPLLGCLGHLPPCPGAGGPAWREVSTRNFQLTTDLPSDEARQILAQLERSRAALLVGFRAQGEVDTGRLPVIVVGQGWSDLAGAGVGGFFTDALFRPLIVLDGGAPLENEESIKHELVHFLSGKVIPLQPRWFSEGLAGYLQTTDAPADSERVTFGQPPAALLRMVRQNGLLGIAEMMAATSIPSDNKYRFYATAWLTVHYLMNHRADELRAYVKALNAPPSGTPAWNRAFPTLTPAQLEWDLRGYLEAGQYSLLIYPFRPPDVPVLRERLLTDADVHATRALVLALSARRRLPSPGDPPSHDLRVRSASELAEARRLEPGHLQGQAIARWMLDEPADLVRARSAVQRQPTDWMAWALLVDALEQHHITDGLQAATDNALDFAAGDRSVELSISRHTQLDPPQNEK